MLWVYFGKIVTYVSDEHAASIFRTEGSNLHRELSNEVVNRQRVVSSNIICESACLVSTWHILCVCVYVCACVRACARPHASQLVVFPKVLHLLLLCTMLNYISVGVGLTALQRRLHRRYERCPSLTTSQTPWPRGNAGTRSESYHGALTASWRRLSQFSTFLPSRRLRLVHTRYDFYLYLFVAQWHLFASCC